jgi:hypothetical protein
MSLTAWLMNLVEQTAAAYGKKITALEVESHLRAWAELVHKVGRTHFEKGLQVAISRSQFFPRVGVIESHIPSGKLIGKPDPDCKKCDGTSWERVFTGMTAGSEGLPGRPVDKVGAVRRCVCWRKVEAI